MGRKIKLVIAVIAVAVSGAFLTCGEWIEDASTSITQSLTK